MRRSQRDFIARSTKSRNTQIVHVTDTVEKSATLAAGADTVFEMTTSSKLGVPVFVQEDISLFESSL